ncbi:MAG: SDR family NAD(P)-dependent oxidoreductase [Verrucomicrobia bacterium]|nr:SDR family NAD(P)-dependent oxidoreductase [Verrucomicrobiota bacterium]
MNDQIEASEVNEDVVAIIGMSCRFPDARNPAAFWQNLCAGHESVRAFSDEELRGAGSDPANRSLPNFVSRGVILDEIDRFDAPFFGLNPRDAEILDPQQRIFLECAWEALEDAGYDPSRYDKLIGVFGGADLSSYLLNLYSNPEIVAAVGPFAITLANDKDHLTTRVAYELNLKGPAITIQTACSTSLVAVCEACQSLLHYRSDIALAGGSSVYASQGGGYFWEEGGINSPDAHCRAFDADARGTVRGSGAGLVVLKRYNEAKEDGDHIYALIRGFGLSNDGHEKIGYTAPSIEGQSQAIQAAILMAALDPETIAYIECHGTATPLGDPIEIAALNQAFQSQTRREQFCGIGSVKTNFGHLNAAAGVAGLIKTVLALQNKMLPPSLNYRRPNPNIDFQNSPFFVIDSLRNWKNGSTPRRAGVSSFGLGGTNAHVILEEAPCVATDRHSREWQILPLSAKTTSALDGITQNLGHFLGSKPNADLADVAYTLQVGRGAFGHRRVALAPRADLSGAAAALQGDGVSSLISGTAANPPAVVFMFPGQGAEYTGMGQELYDSEPAFREKIDLSCDLLRPLLGSDLREIFFSKWPQASSLGTSVVQPGLFVIEYALASLWMDWGVTPQVMVGHSLGEYVAACLANVFTVEDGLRLVAARGRLMQSLTPGVMLAVRLAESDVAEYIEKEIDLAAVNGPTLCVLSGSVKAVEKLETKLTSRSATHQRLHNSHAFHSAMIDPIVDEFVEQVRQIDLRPPSRPYLSNLTGTWIGIDQATDPVYWGHHLRHTVRFAQNLRNLLDGTPKAFLEIGPGRTLATLARQCAGSDRPLVLTSLPHPQEKTPALKMIAQTLGALWASGIEVDWHAVHRGETRHRVSLPTYCFDRHRYWVGYAPGEPALLTANSSARSGRNDVSEWFYAPVWKPALPVGFSTSTTPGASWLLFCGRDAGTAKFVRLLKERGQRVTTVCAFHPNPHSVRTDFCIDPRKPSDYQELLREIYRGDNGPQKIVHWSSGLDQEADFGKATNTGNPQIDLAPGFFSLLYLAKAIVNGFSRKISELTAVTVGAAGVSSWDRVVPEEAMVAGASRVIAQELAGLRSRAIDLPCDVGEKISDSLLEALCTELESEVSEPVLALRDSGRWIPKYLPVQLDPTTVARRLRKHGVYVITGGLGGIGLTIAQHLATKIQAKVVLVSRSQFPDRDKWTTWLETHSAQDSVGQKIRRIRELELAGAEVLIEAVDVTDAPAVEALAERVRAKFGKVNGVIHSAGIAGGGMIGVKITDQAYRVLAAKVRGTQVLYEIFGDEPLDFFVLCSSLNALFGGFGQIDYCAANCYLDAFAYRNATSATHIVSINWDAWAGVGMAVETEVPKGFETKRKHGLTMAITESEGALAFDHVLSGNASQIAVSTIDLQPRIKKMSELSNQSAPAEAPMQRYPRPQLSTPYLAPRDATEEAVANEWSKLLGLSEPGVNDDFLESGGHSLMAVQLISRLRKLFHVEITIAEFFESPTIAGIAKALRQAEGATGQVDAIAELSRQMDAMSPEALEEWLRNEEQLNSLSGTRLSDLHVDTQNSF